MKHQQKTKYFSSGISLKNIYTRKLFAKSILIASMCLSIMILLNPSVRAQIGPTFVRFSFDGTTDCTNEISTADSIASYVVNSPMPQMNRVVINCVQTTSSNNRFNSKDWSQMANKVDYQYDTYAYYEFALTSPYYFSPLNGVDLMFSHKRSGNGPHQGFIRYQFYTSSNTGSGWSETSVWLLSNSTVYDEKYHVAPPDINYTRMRIEFHGFDQKGTAGNGDAEWFDDIRIVGTPDQNLPVELTSFNASVVNQSATLRWNTATEVNNYGFEVERSASGTDWKSIAFIQGHGTVNTPQSYSYRDENIGNLGSSFKYRLKQIDRDGRFEYSPVIEANFKSLRSDFGMISAYPNPFNPSSMLQFFVPNQMTLSLKIYNALGEEVKVLINEETKTAGTYSVIFDAREFASGIYYACLTSGKSFNSVYKLSLMK